MINNYLQILQESLTKKYQILLQIEEKSKEQSEIVKTEPFSMQDIDTNMDEKATLIKQLGQLDKGFDTLYENIRKELLTDKDQYKDEIRTIQKLIADIMEKSAAIETQEARNKASIEEKFRIERKDIQNRKSASDAAYHYYKSANKLNFVNPQFMDKKN